MKRQIPAAALLAVAAWLGTIGCGPGAAEQAATPASPNNVQSKGERTMTIDITSSAFKHGDPIPKKYTGEGVDVSPPLTWKNVPAKAKELVLICDDPDAPTEEPWVHWVIYKIPAGETGLPEGVPRDLRLKHPTGAMQGRNSWPKDNVGYRGPMPPPGHGTHHYYFRLYALDGHLTIEPGVTKKQLLEEIRDHILAEGVLMGTYER